MGFRVLPSWRASACDIASAVEERLFSASDTILMFDSAMACTSGVADDNDGDDNAEFGSCRTDDDANANFCCTCLSSSSFSAARREVRVWVGLGFGVWGLGFGFWGFGV